MPQRIVIQLVHQGYEFAYFAWRKTFARKPAEVMSRQIGDQAALVFPERHFADHQELQVFRVHHRLPHE